MDNVNHPKHYTDGRKHEPIDVIEDWELGFNLGNTVKYISRCGRKDDLLEDLMKAKWYLERQIALVEKKSEKYKKADEMSKESVVKLYAQGVKKYCNGRDAQCNDCVFASPYGECIFINHTIPEDWEI